MDAKHRALCVSLALGQALALLVTCTSVASQLLVVHYGVSCPTSQAFLNYALLNVFAVQLWRTGRLAKLMADKWHWYLVIALADVEANFFVVWAFRYTTLTSIMLLDCWAIPVVMGLAYVTLKTRYKLMHVVGVCLCLAGIALLVLVDVDQGAQARDALKGDLFVLLGATLYAVSNIGQEIVVKSHDRTEFLGMLGLFGAPISLLQVWLLERAELESIRLGWGVAALFVAFSGCLFAMYVFAPVLIQRTSAAFMNLSLLTSDVYGLVAAVLLFRFKPTALFLGAFAAIVAGIITYNYTPPESPIDQRATRQRTDDASDTSGLLYAEAGAPAVSSPASGEMARTST